MMKKLLVILAVIAVFFSFASCGKSSSAPEPTPVPETSVQESVSTAAQSAPAADNTVLPGNSVETAAVSPESVSSDALPVQNVSLQPEASVENIQPVSAPVNEAVQTAAAPAEPVTVKGGNCSVDILSAGTDTDCSGNQVIVVKFKLTNNGSDSVCFGDCTRVDVRQDGRSLNGDGIIFDGNSFDGLAFNFRTPVSNGASITCAYAYPCSSTSDIDVSLSVVSSDSSRSTLGSGSATLSIG